MSASRKGYRLSPRARQDLEDIWLYSFRNWSLEQADGYISDLLSACEDLATGERIGLNAASIRAGYRKHLSGSHALYFTMSDRHIDIIRILHQSRDVDTHMQDEPGRGTLPAS